MRKAEKQEEMKVNIQELRKAMKKLQKKSRFEHTLGVAYTAASLAMRYQESVEDAQLAGMLHDCARCFSDEKMIDFCEKHKLPMTELEKRRPYLLHARVGAFMAEHEYKIENQEILRAIESHTTGRENMSMLEKIVFVADYIEPGRDQAPNLREIRSLAFQDLDMAMLRILEDTLNYLRNSGKEIYPATEVTFAFYKTRYR